MLFVVVNIKVDCMMSVKYKGDLGVIQEDMMMKVEFDSFILVWQVDYFDQLVVIVVDKMVQYDVVMIVMFDLKVCGVKCVGFFVKL